MLVLVPAGLVLALVAVAAAIADVRIPDMTRDVAALAKLHPLAGLLSNLGLILWSATAAVCLFAAAASRPQHARRSRFLLFGGLLSAYLLLDDFFQVHEVIAPQYLGIRERYVYLALAASLLAYLLTFRDVIVATHWPALLLALGFFAASAGSDAAVALLLPPRTATPDWQFFVEDGAKWLGICSWCHYFVGVGRQSWPADARATA